MAKRSLAERCPVRAGGLEIRDDGAKEAENRVVQFTWDGSGARLSLLFLFRERSTRYQIFAALLTHNASLDKLESLFMAAGYSAVATFFLEFLGIHSGDSPPRSSVSRVSSLLVFSLGSCRSDVVDARSLFSQLDHRPLSSSYYAGDLRAFRTLTIRCGERDDSMRPRCCLASLQIASVGPQNVQDYCTYAGVNRQARKTFLRVPAWNNIHALQKLMKNRNRKQLLKNEKVSIQLKSTSNCKFVHVWKVYLLTFIFFILVCYCFYIPNFVFYLYILLYF